MTWENCYAIMIHLFQKHIQPITLTIIACNGFPISKWTQVFGLVALCLYHYTALCFKIIMGQHGFKNSFWHLFAVNSTKKEPFIWLTLVFTYLVISFVFVFFCRSHKFLAWGVTMLLKMAWTWSCWSSWHPYVTLRCLCYGVLCWLRAHACSSFSAPNSQLWQTQQCRLNQAFVTTLVFRDSLCCLHTGCIMLTQPDSPQWNRLPPCWKT